MTNHPNRSAANFRFIAFSTITGQSLAHAATVEKALSLALAVHKLPNADFLEILDCEANGRKVWSSGVTPENPVLLAKARQLHPNHRSTKP